MDGLVKTPTESVSALSRETRGPESIGIVPVIGATIKVVARKIYSLKALWGYATEGFYPRNNSTEESIANFGLLFVIFTGLCAFVVAGTLGPIALLYPKLLASGIVPAISYAAVFAFYKFKQLFKKATLLAKDFKDEINSEIKAKQLK